MLLNSEKIKAAACRLGFTACGLAPAEEVSADHRAYFHQWLAQQHHAGMAYMERYEDIRFNPKLLLNGCQTVISLALNYYPAQRLAPDQLQFAYYAYGKDYHDLLRTKLRNLAAEIFAEIPKPSPVSTTLSASSALSASSTDAPFINEHSIPEPSILFRPCVDTAPILERYWAWRAGLGWIGKNHTLIIPRHGSFFFLAELLVALPADHYDSPQPNHCGTCTRCLEACPAGALSPSSFDSRRCLSYLTIEHRGPFTAPQSSFQSPSPSQPSPNLPLSSQRPVPKHPMLGQKYIYGCDRCQLACPHNRFAQPTAEKALQPSAEFLAMSPDAWNDFSRDDYARMFKGSAVKRVKYDDLLRNIVAFGK